MSNEDFFVLILVIFVVLVICLYLELIFVMKVVIFGLFVVCNIFCVFLTIEFIIFWWEDIFCNSDCKVWKLINVCMYLIFKVV